MTLTLEGLKAQFQHPNVQAFARCVRSAESNNRDDGSAYRTIYGGGLVDDLSCHPRIAKQSPWGYTSAAGAYQAMCAVPGRVQTDTWGDFCRDLGVPVDAMPFDPPTQDAFLVWCVRRRQALQSVLDGDLEKAVNLCSFEWASFPPGRYGQPTTTIDKLRAVFLQYGGRLSNADLIQPAAPIEDHSPTNLPPVQPSKPESSMPIPLIVGVIGTLLSQLIPVVAPLFDKKTETPAKLDAAVKVIDLVVKTTGAVNEQEAVQKLQANPELVKTVTQAIITDDTIMPMLEISSAGMEKAREQAIQYVQSADVWWKLVLNPVLIVTFATLPLVYMIVWKMIQYLEKVSGDVIAQTIGTVIGLVLGGIMGFWMGQTYQNMKAERNSSTRTGDVQPQGVAK
jgi:muramidase (phage lysozyme)